MNFVLIDFPRLKHGALRFWHLQELLAPVHRQRQGADVDDILAACRIGGRFSSGYCWRRCPSGDAADRGGAVAVSLRFAVQYEGGVAVIYGPTRETTKSGPGLRVSTSNIGALVYSVHFMAYALSTSCSLLPAPQPPPYATESSTTFVQPRMFVLAFVIFLTQLSGTYDWTELKHDPKETPASRFKPKYIDACSRCVLVTAVSSNSRRRMPDSCCVDAH